MKVIETKVYEFGELSDRAKEKARKWYRESGFHYPWWDASYEDFYTIAGMLGLDIKPGHPNERGRGIQFTGFYCQGDGASFEGVYRSKAGALEEVKAHAPQDEVLHSIAAGLDAAVEGAGTPLRATIKVRGTYCHAYMMEFEFEAPELEEDQPWPREQEEAVIKELRNFANWIYRTLEQEWDYLNSDEQVDESIVANEYTFTAEGKRFG